MLIDFIALSLLGMLALILLFLLGVGVGKLMAHKKDQRP